MSKFRILIYDIQDIAYPKLKKEYEIIAEHKAEAADLAHDYALKHYPNIKRLVETREIGNC